MTGLPVISPKEWRDRFGFKRYEIAVSHDGAVPVGECLAELGFDPVLMRVTDYDPRGTAPGDYVLLPRGQIERWRERLRERGSIASALEAVKREAAAIDLEPCECQPSEAAAFDVVVNGELIGHWGGNNGRGVLTWTDGRQVATHCGADRGGILAVARASFPVPG